MKCDTESCDREATVHLTEIVNGNITKLHLCEDHAKQKGVEMEQHFGIADLLQGLAEYGAPPVEAEQKRVKCPTCGMGYDDFKKIGRLGCGDCYQTFRESLAPLLKRIHGANQHIGKGSTPGAAAPEPPPAAAAPPAKPGAAKSKAAAAGKGGGDVNGLKEKLRKAIAEERYEEAARIRDEIRQAETPPPKEKKSS
jgi:protein arginine kinase activator